MKTHLAPIGQTDTWITPRYITDALGKFDLDPCAHTDMPWSHADKQYTVHEDGLTSEWFGRVWVNPPFSKKEIGKWMRKMSEHNNGIILLGASMETKKFHKWVWGKASGILFLDTRPYFCLPNGEKGKTNSGQTICLVSYGEDNLASLVHSGLGPVVTEIR